MKLFRYGNEGKEQTGIIINGKKYSTAALNEDYDEIFFATDGLKRLEKFISENKNLPLVADDMRLSSPIARPSKIVCIGLNYAKHAEETHAPIPAEPIIFFKSTTALCGPHDDVIIPKESVKTDWEVELAVIIGKKASYVSEENAMDFVAGYALHNDYSERAFQIERGGQWVKGKSSDRFAPVGPYMATKDEISNPNNLSLWLKVNGELLQNSNTNDMIFHVPYLVSYITQFMTLLPGDIISTGTPFGVGLGFKPPRYLKAGDIVELGIESLGAQKQRAISYDDAVKQGLY
ncbi:MAG: fumarylacetoacetate hydrolase family protein [Bacteroidetes bacterium]|nr:fumarylacetoacetate hydrolase family protein [Bacteroidota bacterium]